MVLRGKETLPVWKGNHCMVDVGSQANLDAAGGHELVNLIPSTEAFECA